MEKNTLIIIVIIGIVIFMVVLIYLAIRFDASMGALANLGCQLWCLLKINISPERWLFGWLPGPDMPGGFCGCPG
ncbi:MAG: hypothetical protein JSV92_01100 [archaeon]|nr:MAG: hypothetical protein JSV92_01100 [archaeon]